MMQLLLDEGVDVNNQCEHYGIALQATSSIKHEKVIRILLKRGANVNVQNEIYGSTSSSIIWRI